MLSQSAPQGVEDVKQSYSQHAKDININKKPFFIGSHWYMGSICYSEHPTPCWLIHIPNCAWFLNLIYFFPLVYIYAFHSLETGFFFFLHIHISPMDKNIQVLLSWVFILNFSWLGALRFILCPCIPRSLGHKTGFYQIGNLCTLFSDKCLQDKGQGHVFWGYL